MPHPSVETLASLPYLRRLTEQDRNTFTAQLEFLQISRRKTVIPRGHPYSGLGFVLQGRLQLIDTLFNEREVGLAMVESGHTFGEEAILEERPHGETVVALSAARIAILPRSAARLLFATVPAAPTAWAASAASTAQAATELPLILAERLGQMQILRKMAALPTPFHRLCGLLLHMGRRGVNGEEGIAPAPTHQELALMINTSRETVTRAFYHLRTAQVIHRRDQVLVLREAGYLRKIVDGLVEPPRIFK